MKRVLAISSVLMILTIRLANADGKSMSSWERPCVVEWRDAELVLGGIRPQQLTFFIWSMDDSTLLWHTGSHRRKDYTRSSRTNSFSIAYGMPRDEWIQSYPRENPPRKIREGEIVCIVLRWSFPFMLTLRGERESTYFKRENGLYKVLSPKEIGDKNIAGAQNMQAKVISALMRARSLPDYPPQLQEPRGAGKGIGWSGASEQ